MTLALQGASAIRDQGWLRHRRMSSSERYFEQAWVADTGRRMAAVRALAAARVFGDVL